MVGEAHSFADGDLGLVRSGAEGLVLVGSCLESEAQLEDARGVSVGDEFSVSERLSVGGVDVDGDLSCSSLVVNLELDSDVEGGSLGSGRRGDSHVQNLGASSLAVVDWAEVDNLLIGLFRWFVGYIRFHY